MKATVVYTVFTALAAFAAAGYVYSTLPEGRPLTETERMTWRGLILPPHPPLPHEPESHNHPCASCNGPKDGCDPTSYPKAGLQWVKGDPTEFPNVCDGTPGQQAKTIGKGATTDANTLIWNCINNVMVVQGIFTPQPTEEDKEAGIWTYIWAIDGDRATREGCGTFTACSTKGTDNCKHAE